ncbi:scavenger receptor cysteine-rich type 1 protein M130-like [Mytilus californianus]|uniref:scavenger receptor cysteine-rich type 1 protein M130-like n=1 Tax=Mytilus californianus TaxID=6549 RepID=UPI002247B7FB|nr:scavenger receptor cysteine-rich type 1 protein M130-like [Mytilus californianus]
MKQIDQGDIRLISRRLEIYFNRTWGTVCNDDFGDIDAIVACKQLGYNDGISLDSIVDDGTGNIWLDDVGCEGNEPTFADCPNKGWGVHNCGHGEDVGIKCFNRYDGDIRLISNRLEILHNGEWGTVCDDKFDVIDAIVACRQLGYNNGISLGSSVSDGNGTTWLDDMECTGNERTLSDCSNNGWGVENCRHSEDVGVKCWNSTEDDIRLIFGRLEIYHNGTWGTVCDDSFDDIDAQVACRQLGNKNGSVLENTIATGTLRIWLDKLQCNGTETHLHECPHTDWGKHSCIHGNVVGIRCFEGHPREGDVRINSSRLEIYHNEIWGTICDDSFDDRDATVACRQLGYNSGKFCGAKVNGTGKIWLSDLKCFGNEPKLSYCSHRGWGDGDCGHHEDVEIECFNLNEGDIRINSGSLEIFHNDEWGSVCREDFDNIDARVACRQLGYRNTDKPTGAYDGVVAFQNVSNDAKSEEEIYDIVE